VAVGDDGEKKPVFAVSVCERSTGRNNTDGVERKATDRKRRAVGVLKRGTGLASARSSPQAAVLGIPLRCEKIPHYLTFHILLQKWKFQLQRAQPLKSLTRRRATDPESDNDLLR